MSRPSRCSALVTCLLTGLLTAAVPALGPASAAPGPGRPSYAGQPLPATRAAAAPVRATITFTKNYRHQWRSTVTWRAWRRSGGTWHLVAHDSWRAGSGFGGPGTEDACAKGRGWLPNGRYSLVQYDDYHGTLIHGRAFRLADKRCRNGTLRQQLFLHTEASAGNGQCPDAPGDQPCRWEYPKINDYRSSGCIKLAPPDLLALTRAYHRYFAPRVRYRMARIQLVVR
jgi:hypothetical protein